MFKITPINNKIFNIGTKFVVTENTKDNTFGPGTTGFISYVKGHDIDYSNVVYLQTVIIKRGKNGKKRLDNNELSTPIFDIEDENLSKIMPDEKRKFYVHIEQVIPYEKNIMDMTDIDFIGWAHCKSMYVNKLSKKSNITNSWPNDEDHYLNKILNINEFFTEEIQHKYSEYEFRKKFTQLIRLLESTLVKNSLIYMMKVAEIEKKAISDLYTQKLNMENISMIKETIINVDKKLIDIYALTTNHGKNYTKNISMEW